MSSEIVETLSHSVKLALASLEKSYQSNGSYHTGDDLGKYFKHPLMLISAKKPRKAKKTLRFVAQKYLQDNGDFFDVSNNRKSQNGAYQEFWYYINGWMLRAANLLGEKEIFDRSMKYVSDIQATSGGCYTHEDHFDDITDVITTAHFGLVYLECEKGDKAKLAGDYLCALYDLQPNIDDIFYLRIREDKGVIEDFDPSTSMIHGIKKSEPDQLYFMIAYPIAFLCELYLSTGMAKYLRHAKLYASFLLECHDSVYSSEFSHKFAWGLSKLNRIEENGQYVNAIERIVQSFVSKQGRDGLWFGDDSLKAYDQTAEIVCWFLEIRNNCKPYHAAGILT